jgi:DNA helicase MCM9
MTATSTTPPSPPSAGRHIIDETQVKWKAEHLWTASYSDLGSPQEVESRFKHHLLSLKSCRKALLALLESPVRNNCRHYSLEVDVFEILEADPVLGHLMLKFPGTLLPLLEKSIVVAQRELKRELETSDDNGNNYGLDEDQDNALNMSSSRKTTYVVKGEARTRVHGRIYHLPPTCCRTSIAAMEATDVGKIIQISGTCVRTSPVQMYESARTYKCVGKNGCGETFTLYPDMEERNNAMVEPDRCTRYTELGQRCPGTNLQLQPNDSVHTDYQEIKIQEQAAKLSVGHIPRSLLIKLEHDLVDVCHPGDEIVVVGSLLSQWQQNAQAGLECQVGMALKAHSIRVIQEHGASAWQQGNETGTSSMGELEKFRKEFDAYWERGRHNPIAARDFICSAVCPKLYGLKIIKLALLITLIGGVPVSEDGKGKEEEQNDAQGQNEANQSNPQPFRVKQNKSPSRRTAGLVYCEDDIGASKNIRGWQLQQETRVKTKRRDMSHLLLIGDPGTGKSQILRFAAALCPRAVLTTGVGTTSAGLTCAAVREGNDRGYSLEAGALVLADKSVCCIDEFGCIRNEDRLSILEALEQQSISVAKAGIVCRLQCRATVIGVMNPRNCIYDNRMSLAQNTGLGTPLLSRFDLIFKLVDSSDPARDEKVTHYLLDRAIVGAGFECNNSKKWIASETVPWPIEKLRAYIAIVKERFEPNISEEAALLLEKHYQRVRSAQSFTIPVTVRFLESLIRLTQAHARLMYRKTAELDDAVAVLRVMECSAYAYGGFDGNVPDFENVFYCDPLDMDLPVYDSPDDDFLVFQYNVLRCYDMLHGMSDTARSRALTYINGDVGTSAQDWRNFDNPRDVQTSNVVHDHYGRSYFPADPRTPGAKRRRL